MLYSRYFELPGSYSMTSIQVWPVIHVLDEQQALANAQVAVGAGAAGVFLIQMEGRDELIDPIARTIRQALPDLKVGVNYLSLPAEIALERALHHGWEASWSDRPGVRSDGVSGQAREIANLLRSHPDHLYFGSVAFKYQPIDPHPAGAARAARALGMIPTTSGDATGSAPPAEKLRTIRAMLGSDPLAVASGITPDNLHELGPYLTHVLVATGIGKDFYHFCPGKLEQLMQAASSCSRAI